MHHDGYNIPSSCMYDRYSWSPTTSIESRRTCQNYVNSKHQKESSLVKKCQKWIARQLHANQRRNPNNINMVQLRSVPSLPNASSIFHKHPSLSWSHSSNLLTISMDHESLDAQTPKTVQLSWFLDPTANKPQLAYKHVFWSLTAYLLQRDWHSTWPVPAERAFPANSAIVMKANLGSHLMSYSQSQEVHMRFRSVCN